MTTLHPRSVTQASSDSHDLYTQGAGADCDGEDIDAEACTGDGDGSCVFEFPPAWKPEFSVTKVTDDNMAIGNHLVLYYPRLMAKVTLRACCWESGLSTTSVWTSPQWTRTRTSWWRCSPMILTTV